MGGGGDQADVAVAFAAAVAAANSVGSWVPLGYAATVAGVVLATKGIGFLIKIARMVLSVFTGGGGSAS